jgi:hypothetical protein
VFDGIAVGGIGVAVGSGVAAGAQALNTIASKSTDVVIFISALLINE